MIKVQFKNSYENVYGGQEYSYKDCEGIEVGDIVVVNTKNGFAIAKVSQVGVEDYQTNPDRLSTIEQVIVTQKSIDAKKKAEYEKNLKIARFLEQVKRENLLVNIISCTNDREMVKLFSSLSTDELERVYKALTK